MLDKLNLFHLIIGHLDALLTFCGIENGIHVQALFVGGGSDALYGDLNRLECGLANCLGLDQRCGA
jgi:hypothetical protein